MTVFAWAARLLLLLVLLVFFLPVELFLALAFASPLGLALVLLALVVFALGIVFALVFHVLGNLIDILLILGLIGVIWKWPRHMRGSFFDKLRVAVYSLRHTVTAYMRRLTGADIALIGTILVIVLVLSLSSGLLHFLLTVAVVLLAIGIIWKWPRNPRIGFWDKLHLALWALWGELRRRRR